MVNDRLLFAINLPLNSNRPTSKCIRQRVTTNVGDVHDDDTPSLRNSDSSRRKTLVELSLSSLTVPSLCNTRHTINEIHCILFSCEQPQLSVRDKSLEQVRGHGRLPLYKRVNMCARPRKLLFSSFLGTD